MKKHGKQCQLGPAQLPHSHAKRPFFLKINFKMCVIFRTSNVKISDFSLFFFENVAVLGPIRIDGESYARLRECR